MTTTEPLDFTLLMSPLIRRFTLLMSPLDRSLGTETARLFDVARTTYAVMLWLDELND
jgi:hypothetical protein